MPGAKIKIKSSGIIKVLKSIEVQNDLDARGKRMQSALPQRGEEWDVLTRVGRDRASTVVATGNSAARKTQAETNALMRALDQAR